MGIVYHPAPVYVGIDPGLGGAIAGFLSTGQVFMEDTPTIKIKSGKSNKQQIDLSVASSMLRRLNRHAREEDTPIHVVLEKVGAMPGQGVTSMFNFGMGYGMWQGILAALEIPYTLVHPATWKKVMMPDATKEKDASILRVCQLFPKTGRDLNRKKDHGRADALLLAAYGRLMNNGGPSLAATKKRSRISRS